MSEWYVRCLDLSEGQVRTSQVRTGQVRTGQDRCLAGVLRVSGGCIKCVSRVSQRGREGGSKMSGRDILDVQMVWEVSRCI